MGRFFYALYAFVVIIVMSRFSFSSDAAQYRQGNANSYYYGSSASRGSSGGGHK
jgi:hypothetical protein